MFFWGVIIKAKSALMSNALFPLKILVSPVKPLVDCVEEIVVTPSAVSVK